jgi:predicted O-methyltransferase YrrM
MALALPPDGLLVTCDRDEGVLALASAAWADAGVLHKARPQACFARLLARICWGTRLLTLLHADVRRR